MIDYTRRAQTIRSVLALRATNRTDAEYIDDAKLEFLDRIETGLADSLRRGGMSAEAAKMSAFEFVRQCVAHYRAGA